MSHANVAVRHQVHARIRFVCLFYPIVPRDGEPVVIAELTRTAGVACTRYCTSRFRGWVRERHASVRGAGGSGVELETVDVQVPSPVG